MTLYTLPVEQPTVVDYLKRYLQTANTNVDKKFFHNITKLLHSDISQALVEHKDSGNYIEQTCAYSAYSDLYKLRKHLRSVYEAEGFNKYSTLDSEMAISSTYRKQYNNNYSINTNISRDINKFSSNLENFSFQDYYSSLLSIDSYDHSSGNNTAYDTKEVLFPGVRYVGENIVIFEMPPTKKHLSYTEAYREHENSEDLIKRQFYIPVPWQVYIAAFDSKNMRVQQVQMYFSSSPILSYNHRLYLAPILNFYSNGVLCRPMFSAMEDYEKYPTNISGVVASSYDWVWNSGYNFDITENISESIVSKSWHKMIEHSTLNSDIKQKIHANLSNLRYMSNKLGTSLVADFYKLWESVPIEKILSCDWISFCIKEAYFSAEAAYYFDSHQHEVYTWVKENLGLEVITEHYEEGDEPDDYYDENEESRYVHVDNLISNNKYRSFVMEKLFNRETTLIQSLEKTNSFVKSHFGSSDVNHFYEFLLKIHQDVTAKVL